MTRRLPALLALLLVAASGLAQTVVDRCGWDTEPGGARNLARALGEGGRVVFACPPGTEIRMTTGHTVAPGTTLDGGGAVTLDARGAAMTMFRVPSGSFALEDITIQNAALPRSGFPGAVRASVVHASGDLSLSGVSIVASEAPVLVRGDARIVDSAFLGNASWAVTVQGEAVVERSRFIGNGTGLSLRRGVVRGGGFFQNTTGALRIAHPTGGVEVIRSEFGGNEGQGAILLSQRSGPDGTATVSIERSAFWGNASAQGGGAITIYDSLVGAPPAIVGVLRGYPPARFEFAYDSFRENHGLGGGAIQADLHDTAGLVVRGGIFVGNTADGAGGAMAWTGRSVLIGHSLFRGNRAARGGALFADGLEDGSRWVVVNSLVAQNEVEAGGGIVEVGPVELYNVTIARNAGVGFAADVHGSPPEAPLVVNAILAENRDGNCRGVAAGAFRGANLQFGHEDCPGVPVDDPRLDALYVPAPGSPALALGDVASCRAPPVSRTDLVFQSRATDDRCALGAFERPPLRRVPPTPDR